MVSQYPRLSLVLKWNTELLEASNLKLSKGTGWSQIGIWPLMAVDFFDWGHLFVKGQISECLPTLTLTLISVDFLGAYFEVGVEGNETTTPCLRFVRTMLET